jgi:hypothetical protein
VLGVASKLCENMLASMMCLTFVETNEPKQNVSQLGFLKQVDKDSVD